jgi:hypothetical protein
MVGVLVAQVTEWSSAHKVQLLITLSVSFLAVWLFLNLKYQNRNKRWGGTYKST